jgi:hypothetical protein
MLVIDDDLGARRADKPTRAEVLARIVQNDDLRVRVQGQLSAGIREDGDCRLWSRATNGKKGYGVLGVLGTLLLAHRAAFAAYNAPVLPGQIVRHKCDRPLCVNPAHLLLGTHCDNARDAIERGRQSRGGRHSATMKGRLPSGQKHYRALLTDIEVDYARRLRGVGLTYRTIAAELGVKERTVVAVCNGENRSNAAAAPWSLPGDAQAIARARKLREGKLIGVLPSQRGHIERSAQAALERAALANDGDTLTRA